MRTSTVFCFLLALTAAACGSSDRREYKLCGGHGYPRIMAPAQAQWAIEGPLGMTECSGEHSSCEHETHCGVRSKWLRINDVVADALRGVSLAEMMPANSIQPISKKSIPLHLAKA